MINIKGNEKYRKLLKKKPDIGKVNIRFGIVLRSLKKDIKMRI